MSAAVLPVHLEIAAAYRRRIAPAPPVHRWATDEARLEQLPPPGAWRFWLTMAGRGWGKTRCGAEYVHAEVRAGRAAEVMLIASTTADVRDVVVEGPSGIVKVCERAGWRVRYEPSKQRVVFPNGAIARTRSAEEPDRIRGPEADLEWWDEFGVWAHRDAFTNADFGLRRLGPNGERARAVVTFTPRPTPLVKELIARPDAVLVRGRTDENAANLDPATLASLRARYSGTRLGRQELAGELLEDTPGALWTLAQLDAGRIAPADVPALVRIVVGVDPAASSGEESAETGIVVVGVDDRAPAHGYVLADATIRGSPHQWASAVCSTAKSWNVDRIAAEVNQGGEMVAHTIRTVWPDAPLELVHASRGKHIRAEPIAALAEQGRWHHAGSFPFLESQLSEWVPGMTSPDRLDAMVHAAVCLNLSDQIIYAGIF